MWLLLLKIHLLIQFRWVSHFCCLECQCGRCANSITALGLNPWVATLWPLHVAVSISNLVGGSSYDMIRSTFTHVPTSNESIRPNQKQSPESSLIEANHSGPQPALEPCHSASKCLERRLRGQLELEMIFGPSRFNVLVFDSSTIIHLETFIVTASSKRTYKGKDCN